ncbi:hypothetical protein PPL_10899 [Heterostelium album PN500]|uniref:COI1 F-box domain-containing protein n=1 Tax=Heterostelium pallidum (strain ATCC 26659 / Pp 5 / PN500) TaxID=670386 RepID=D3BSA7_HETP5|nr:hypothetical protein PPL_10899 [Heterostelium album PN500]EFA75844.1 hypothetical protein PPL_10899 [Heterostelium album PN500]|eukprot:XP_020427978.1 hypothetical protein PPL_10899 [Heterostelium album PN500]
MNNQTDKIVNLSHLILNKIISYLDDNIDRICFSLVCKRWYNDRDKYLIFNTDSINLFKLKNTVINQNHKQFKLPSYHNIFLKSIRSKTDCTLLIGKAKYYHSYDYHFAVIRNKIFESVRDIHDQLAINSLRCDWYDLACFPDQLIKFNYIERYKQIFHTIVREDNNNNIHTDNYKDWIHTIRKFRQLYLDSVRNAFDVGNLEAIEFIQKSFPNELEYSLYVNRDHYINNLEIIQFLHNKAPRWFRSQGSDVLDNAALGSFQVFKWLYKNRSERPTYSYLHAARVGNLETIKVGTMSIVSAVLVGHVETLKYLLKNMKIPCDGDIVKQVVANYGLDDGQIFSTVKYLMENTKQDLSNTLIDDAAKKGLIEVVKYLIENTTATTYTSITMDAVAGHGDLEFLKQLHNKHMNCTAKAMHMAENGHIEVVRFLHENRTEGCRVKELDIPAKTMDYFAKYKDSSALQWLKDNSTLQCSHEAYLNAIHKANLPIIKWIRENTSLPFPSNLLEYATKLENSDLKIVQYLLDNGETCSVKELKCCHKLSNSWASEVMANAIKKDNVPIIKYLLQNTSEHLTTEYSQLTYCKAFDYSSRLKLLKLYNL